MNKLDGNMIAALERVLLARRSALSLELRTRLQVDEAGPADTQPGISVPVEQAQADLLCERAVAKLGQECRELDAVELALARVADGSYGRCDHCGEGIPLPRLRAQPAAALCLACQQEIERHYHVPAL